MANVIRIKRSASTNTPASLTQGELANSEVGSPNGLNELFVGTTGPTVFKLIRNLNGAPAEPTAGLAAATPVTSDYIVFEDVTDSQGKRVLFSATPLSIFDNDSGWEANQTITTGLGIDGADAGSSGNITISLGTTELTDTAIAAADQIVFNDATDELPKKYTASSIPISIWGAATGTVSMADNTLSRPLLQDFAIEHTAPTVSGNAVTCDLTNGNSFLVDMEPATGTVTLTLSNPPASGTYGEANIMVQCGTTYYGITWPGSITWLYGGSAPTLTTTNNEIDVIHVFTVDGGTTWYGTYALAAASAASADLQKIHADFQFNSSTSATDPGAGYLKYNSATPASVTNLYIDDLEYNGNDWAWILDNLATNDIIEIKSHDDPADYLVVQVSGTPTDNTGSWTVPVTVLFSGSLPTADDLLQVDVQWFSQGTAGTVTSVTAGTGLINSGTASAPVLDFDFSELTDMTASISGTTEFILQNGTTESRKTANEIDLQFFDNSSALFVGQGDTGSASWTWIIDDDTMGTASATTVPTSESVKAYVDGLVSSPMNYKGGYNASTNTPDLDTTPTGISIGDTYTVTAAGTFFTEAVQVGDMLVSNQDNPTALSHWTVVQDNLGAASETAAGYIEIATQAEVDAASSTTLAVVPNYLHNTTFDGGSF